MVRAIECEYVHCRPLQCSNNIVFILDSWRTVHQHPFGLAFSLYAAVCGFLGVSNCYCPEGASIGYFVPSFVVLAWHLLRLRLP